MRSETSSFKARLFYPVLWKKNMTRFWPIWAIYGLCWLFAMPLELFYSRQGGINGITYPQYFADVKVLSLINPGCVVAALVFGILSAMAVFSYLYNNRSVGLFHALPVRREGLFLTSYLSGLSFQVLPAVAIFLLTALAEAVLGVLNVGALGMWLAMQVLMTLFFYSFAVFCAMFTGHILALPAFYGILNGLALGMATLINETLNAFVFGFTSIGESPAVATWLTPAYQLVSKMWVDEIWSEGSGLLERVAFHGLGYALIYALVGLALAGLALALYRRRDLEGAGDVVTVKWVRPIFKYGVAFCSALALGLMLHNFFMLSGVWTLLICMVLCGWVGYFAAEMLLEKSFRVFRKNWKGCVIFTLCLVAVTVGLDLDVTGFERRVPARGRVSAVSIHTRSSAPYDDGSTADLTCEDPAVIEAVSAVHEAVIRERALHENTDGQGNLWATDGTDRETARSVDFRLTYTLANGAMMDRNYTLWVREEDLQDPHSAASLLTDLLNRPEIVEETYFQNMSEEWFKFTGASVELLDTETGEYDTYPVPTAYREELMAAIRDDMKAGRLGRRYLLDDEARQANCYYSDITLFYTSTATDPNAPGDTTVTITPQTTSVETLEVLKEAGVIDKSHVLQTQAERSDQLAQSEEKEHYAETEIG